jgi:polyisoprenyl-teichoic acid--peptidoglycan teichoic acid transferase
VASASGGARLRRSWPQRLLIGFNVVLIVACLSGAGGLAYLYQRFGDLPRIDFGDGVLEKPPEDPGEPQNFLLVGSDDRANLDDPEAFGTTDETGESKSDTIMLVRVDPQEETAAMLSFPRDLWVEIAGTGEESRINTAFSAGGREGARRLIDTIKLNFNIPVHHYAEVDFEGFRRVVDAVGGIKVYLPNPVRDYGCEDGPCRNLSGLDIRETGCIELDGQQALSYVRSRHFQEQINGRWRSDPTGDLGRTQRQQDFVRRALHKALSEDLLNPVRLNRLVNVAIDTVVVDKGLGVDDIVDLGERFRDLSPDRLQQYTLNQFVENTTTSAGASVLELQDGPEVQAIFDVFRGNPADSDRPVAPSSVTLQVLNGSGQPGQARSTTDSLSETGFQTRPPGDSSNTATTTILYASGQDAKADLVARYLVTSDPVLRETSGLEAADVVLVTGADFRGIREEPRPPDGSSASPTTSSSTTTTAPELSEGELYASFLDAVARNQCQN